MESKIKTVQINWFTKQNRLTDLRERTSVYQGEWVGGGQTDWEVGMDMYTQLHLNG